MATFLNNFHDLEIQLEEIRSATNNFDDSRVIGSGGFGKVYKGELTLPEGKSMVAFKRLDRIHGQGVPEFFKEIRMLSSYKHDNLISLLGYCNEGNEMILIYEYASRGSLKRILNDSALTWTQRLKICIDAAEGLSFLHDPNGSLQRVLHRDIKSANILLDENLNAKVADFGLSKIGLANQQHTFLVTNPVGTHGYCDPLYMESYQLTKESDVYSFGVLLFEVLCGRVCYEYSNGELKVFVHFWKKCYEQNKLEEIIFLDIKHQLDPSSVKKFVDIAYQCLQKSREQRPTMSVVVEKLKAALESKELHDLKLQREYEQEEMRKAAEYKQEEMRKAAEYEMEEIRKTLGYELGEIIRAADPPLIYKSIKELKALLSKGFPVNGEKRMVLVNDKGQVSEWIHIEACLDQIYRREYVETSRFIERHYYYIHRDQFLKVRVRAQFLSPLITYCVNLIFRNVDSLLWRDRCKTLHYKLNGEKKCCMVYDTYKRENGWFVVPLHHFTSDHEIVDFDINVEGSENSCELQITGFVFQPLEEKVELHDQWLEEYQDIIKAASQSLLYRSLEELKVLLSKGFHINNYNTWFSLNENGEHCEMLSIAHCLIPREGGYSFYHTDLYSRFPCSYYTKRKRFKVLIRTQFLTPSIKYTVNIVLCKGYSLRSQIYVALRYKSEGETETSVVYLATETQDGYSFIAELYQFTSNGRTFDLEIVFEDHKDDLEVEGILFQPLEKVEHEQVLENEKLSNDSLRWTIKKDLFSNLFKKSKGQKGYSVDKNGKKCLMLSARGVITSWDLSFQSLPESRFKEVAVVTASYFNIVKEIKSDLVSPQTTYACYLVYKSTKEQPVLENKEEGLYIYLSPRDTPIIGQKLDQNIHSPLNRPNLNVVPRQRSDGWMEVKVKQFQTPSYSVTIHMEICLCDPSGFGISGLIIESIELRPIGAFSLSPNPWGGGFDSEYLKF